MTRALEQQLTRSTAGRRLLAGAIGCVAWATALPAQTETDCLAPPSAFATAPQPSLCRAFRFEPMRLPDGLRISQRLEEGRDGGAVLRSRIANTTQRAVSVAVVPVLSASLRLRPPSTGPYQQIEAYEAKELWYDSAYWTAGGWARVGKDWHHPGPGLPTVRAFTCPRTGAVTVSGRVFKKHLQPNGGVKATIRHGLLPAWSVELKGDDGEGADPALTLTVTKGDTIRFIVDANGEISCDTTGWDPVITYADGQSHRASESFGPKQGAGGWTYEAQRGDPGTVGFKPLAYNKSTWYESTFWQGTHTWCRVGKNWHHPGDNLPSVRCFRCPTEGKISVTGRVFALHKDGDGTIATILHNRRQLWTQRIAGDDGKGVETDLSLTVNKGDSIRFLVAQGGHIYCDTTGWDPVITYENGASFRASEGFSPEQGGGHWFYEMDREREPPPPPPVRGRLDTRLFLRRETIRTTMDEVAPDAASPSFFVLSDAANRSGLSLGVDTAEACAFRTELQEEGALLRLDVTIRSARTLQPGEEVQLPIVALHPYEGTWMGCLGALRSYAGFAGRTPLLPALATRAATAYEALPAAPHRLPSPELLALVQAEWLREDAIDGTAASWQKAVTQHVTGTRRLLDGSRGPKLADAAALLTTLEQEAAAAGDAPARLQAVYQRIRLLKRHVLFQNPLFGSGRLLFGQRRLSRWSHLNMQYFGFRARAGGGIFVLEEPGFSTAVRSVVGDRLPPGSFLEPRLSFDAKRVVFSYVPCGETELDGKTLGPNEESEDTGFYHLYEIGVDGSELRQLTRGKYDDLMPSYLPDGGIVFCSTRRKSYSRCFGPNYSWRWHAYTLYRIDADSRALKALSFNDVAEWFPEVSNSGHILFARWDYIDRDAVTHQNLWAMRPDGTNPTAVWGNASPKPQCMFQAKPVPGSSKIAFIASAHHALTGGPLCLVDPTVDSNSDLRAITRITPQPFPEAEGFNLPDYYEFAWPLAEDLFLVGYSNTYLRSQGQSYKDPTPDNALGIYLLDAHGNRELIYRDPLLNASTPIPLRPRPCPPILQSTLATDADGNGELIVTDVYRGLGDDIQRGTIKEIRVVQIFPKTTALANNPPIGFAGEENARAVLGTVPVETDGSARFTVPAGKPLLFQALDRDGFAYQVMRSTTSVQPGERTSCIGCHENRMGVPTNRQPAALARPPSKLAVGPFDGKPFSYMRVVQPVWDEHCIRCHGDKAPKGNVCLTSTVKGGFAQSYRSLCGGMADFNGGKTNPEQAAKALVPRFGQRNQVQVTPVGGVYGARESRLMKMLRSGHSEVKLSDSEMRRVALWIDLNAIFYGAYLPDRRAAQLAGADIGMPEIQ